MKVLAIRSQKERLNLTALLARAISHWKKVGSACKLIEGERIEVLEEIGKGHFGKVFRGKLFAPRGDESNIKKMNEKLEEYRGQGECAIKTVKPDRAQFKEDLNLRWV